MPDISHNTDAISLVSPSKGFFFAEVSKENLERIRRRDAAAQTLMGAYCSNCYIVAEIIDYLMADTFSIISKKPWYKHKIKHLFKLSHTSLLQMLRFAVKGSPTNSNYMHATADAQYEIMRPDLELLRKALRQELDKIDCPDYEVVAELYLIDIMFAVVNMIYDDAKERSEAFHKLNYDEIYISARCTKPASLWRQAMEIYCNEQMKGFPDIDLNNNSVIASNISTVVHRIYSDKIAEQAHQMALEEADPGEAAYALDESLREFGIQVL